VTRTPPTPFPPAPSLGGAERQMELSLGGLKGRSAGQPLARRRGTGTAGEGGVLPAAAYVYVAGGAGRGRGWDVRSQQRRLSAGETSRGA